MKGITPVIAVILLLLITVSMAGFAFIFLQRSLETTTTSTQQGLEEQLSQQRQKFAIDNINGPANIVYVRHTGTATSDTSKVTIYRNNTLVNCTWDVPGSWSPGGIKSCTNATISCSGSTKIDVAGPGGRDSTIC